MGKENRRLKVIIIVGAILVGLSEALFFYEWHRDYLAIQKVPGPPLPLWVLNGDDGAPEDLSEDTPEDAESDQDHLPIEQDWLSKVVSSGIPLFL